MSRHRQVHWQLSVQGASASVNWWLGGGAGPIELLRFCYLRMSLLYLQRGQVLFHSVFSTKDRAFSCIKHFVASTKEEAEVRGIL